MTIAWLQQLRDELDALAAATWHKIEVGPSRGLAFGEESITDHNLFELDRRCAGIEVFKFDHREEALNGADFEWFVGGASAGGIGMRFQAKKLDDGHYLHLGHQVAGERQYDLLLRRAYVDNMWPFYCFYNGWAGGWPRDVTNVVCPKNVAPIRLGSAGRRCIHADLDDFGCAIAPAGRVAGRHRSDPRAGRLALDDYLAFSRPWSHLFLETTPSSLVGATAPGILDDLTSRLKSWHAARPGDAVEDEPVARPWRDGPSDGGRFSEFPGWLAAVRDGRAHDDEGYLPRVAVVLDVDQAGASDGDL